MGEAAVSNGELAVSNGRRLFPMGRGLFPDRQCKLLLSSGGPLSLAPNTSAADSHTPQQNDANISLLSPNN